MLNNAVKCADKSEIERRQFCVNLRQKLIPSVVRGSRPELRKHSSLGGIWLNGSLHKLSERLDRPLTNGFCSIVVIIHGAVFKICTSGPIVRTLVPCERKDNWGALLPHRRWQTSTWIAQRHDGWWEALWNWTVCKRVSKNIRETAIGRVNKVNDCLKIRDLLAVPFDKGREFCVMNNSMYLEKMRICLNLINSKESMGEINSLDVKIFIPKCRLERLYNFFWDKYAHQLGYWNRGS